MTGETPCRPECGCVCGHDNDWHAVAVGACRSREHCNCSKFVARAHAPNCPSAKPAETPCVAGCINAEFHDEYHRPNAPKPAEPETCRHCKQSRRCCGGVCCNCKRELPPYFGPQYKPAEPPACGCHGPCGSADCCERCGEPQGSEGSEPPIDWPEAEKVFCQMQSGYTYIGKGPEGYLQNAARAYLALKAERDALLGKAAALELELKASDDSRWSSTHNLTVANEQIAGLKVRVEELSESLLWATSSYEERVVILTRREKRKEQEASNG